MGLKDLFTRTNTAVNTDEKNCIEQSPQEIECSRKRYKIPLCKTSKDVKRVMKSFIFPCPSCDCINSVDLSELDPVLGTEIMCLECQNMLHIPGGYLTQKDLSSLAVYASLPVAISKFPLFYANHPIIRDLTEQGITGIIIQYGIWGFCQKCHHHFSPAVLINLPTSGETADIRSLTSDETVEMNSLRKGRCPYCQHRILQVIVSDIPSYVISASDNISHRWDED